MLQLLDRLRLQGLRADLARIEIELDLTADQQSAWNEFRATYDEVRDAIEAVDAMTGQIDDRPPTLQEALEQRGRRFAVRLGAARQLSGAAVNLFRVLQPQQRRRADRLLAVLVRELSVEDDGRVGVAA